MIESVYLATTTVTYVKPTIYVIAASMGTFSTTMHVPGALLGAGPAKVKIGALDVTKVFFGIVVNALGVVKPVKSALVQDAMNAESDISLRME